MLEYLDMVFIPYMSGTRQHLKAVTCQYNLQGQKSDECCNELNMGNSQNSTVTQ